MVDAISICAIMNSKLKKRSGAETDVNINETS